MAPVFYAPAARVEAARSPLMKKKEDIQTECPLLPGAGNEARTRYLHLGKVALYQMSYARGTGVILTEHMHFVKQFP